MYTTSPGCQFFDVEKTLSNCPHRVLLDKALQALEETPDDFEKAILITTNFHWFRVDLFKLLSPQLNNETDSDSVINTVLIHFLNLNHLLEMFFVHRSFSDSEKFANIPATHYRLLKHKAHDEVSAKTEKFEIN